MADQWSWNAGNGLWSNAANWSPNTVPGNIPGVEIVRIGNLPGVANDTVLLHIAATPPDFLTINELHLTSGMTLDTNGDGLSMYTNDGAGSTTLSGANTRLLVRPCSDATRAYDLYTQHLSLSAGTQLQLVDNSEILLGATTSSGVISGRGTIRYAALFRNDGVIAGTNNGGLTLEYTSNSTSLDLDGASGGGQLSMASPFSQITVIADAVADAFGGTVTMGTGSILDMNVLAGWTADANSTFNVSSAVVGAAAQIDGTHFTFGGDLNIGGSQGHLRLLADTTLTNSADVFLGTDDRLEFDGATIVQGGLYALSDGARIDFDAATEMGGGTFNMVGGLPSQGVVNFNGDTQWSGTTTINGFGRQNGDANIDTSATINASVFDMDGNSGGTTWDITHRLDVNTQAIEFGSQLFDGTMNIDSGIAGRLTMNLADSGDSWTMNGTLNLAGLGALTITRVAGSRMIVTGELNMGNGIAQVTSDTAFQGADVSIVSGGNLRMFGGTSVDAATTFAGAGTLQNGVGGVMLLHSGIALGQVGLTNSGVLRIGESGAGVAAVDRFSSTATASWGVDIGGNLAGTNHDVLLVTGGATTLDGQLAVSLLSGFAPQSGDEFTILFSLGGVSGTFTNDPVTQLDGLTYEWSIIYNPNSVVLRLDHIVPAPGGFALLALSGLLAARRRRG